MAALERARLRMANIGYEMALFFDDEIICEGSDAEDSPLAKAERQKRRENIELRYLAGHSPLIMSAQLRGPFDKNIGWVNPWRSKRPTQKQTTNRAAVTEPANLAHKSTSIVTLGKRSRNDSNLPSSVGTRTNPLAECSSTSMDIVNNRQPEQPQLYSGFKQFAANRSERPTDFANLNERENILQKPNAGMKRRADTNWLKGADVGKRSRNNWSDPTSPTPKERTRDISGSDKSILDTSSMSVSNVNMAKFNRQLPDETTSLFEFEDIPLSTADFVHSKGTAAQRRGDGNVHPAPLATAKAVEDKRREIPIRPVSSPRSPPPCRRVPSTSEPPPVESVSNVESVDGDESDSAIENGRTAPEYSLRGSPFGELVPSSRHKSVQSCASTSSFEPSPVRSLSRSQLSQEILHGLSQASRLARSAEQLTPRKLDGSKLNVEPSKIGLSPLNHASQTRNQSHPLLKSPAGVKMLNSKRNDKSESFDSPLPPGSLKYRRVRRKAPTPVRDNKDNTNAVVAKQKTPDTASLQPIELQGSTHQKDVVSFFPGGQGPDLADPVKPQFPTSDSRQQLSNSVPIIEIADNNAALEAKLLDRDHDDQALIHTSTTTISPVPKDVTNGLKAGHEDCLELITNDGESEGLLIGQEAPGSQPPPVETITDAISGNVKHTEEAPSSKAATGVVARERNPSDVALSEEPSSPLSSPELADNESTLGQIIQPHGGRGPSSKSSPLPPLPDTVDDEHAPEASFTSAPEEADSLPVPQSPWAAEAVPVPQPLPADPVVATGNFSMSQSKDAPLLLAEVQPHHSTAKSTKHDVKLSSLNPQSADYNPKPPQSNELVISAPESSELIRAGSAPPSPRPLSHKSHTPQSARVGNQDLLPLSNPWVNNTQSPTMHPHPSKRKKRVSFYPMSGDSDKEDKQPGRASNSAPERDLSSPPPPPEAESLTQRDNSFHRKLKWTSGILSRRSSKGPLRAVPGENIIPPGSPGVAAMAEAFLAADGKVQAAGTNLSEVHDKRIFAESENFDQVEHGDQQEGSAAASVTHGILVMTESQLVNPWGDNDEAPPFSMADCAPVEDDGLVEDVLSDMDAMLGDWNVDAELDRAKRAGRGNTERDVTARERLVGTGY